MKAGAARKVGFIGAGNMATAMLRGILQAKLYRPSDLWVTDVVPEKRRSLKQAHGIDWADGNAALVRGSQVIVLAVKPQTLPDVLGEVRSEVTARKLFLSIAAGFTLERLQRGLGAAARIVRVMPNTPALLGKGMSVIVRGDRATSGDERLALRMFRAVGDAVSVRSEALLDPVTGLSGSGPAYVYLFAEALIAGGVRQGLPEDMAGRLAFQTLEGACAMLKEAGMSPKELRDMVASPGGTTLAGLAHLEKAGLFDAVAGAVAAATERSRDLARL